MLQELRDADGTLLGYSTASGAVVDAEGKYLGTLKNGAIRGKYGHTVCSATESADVPVTQVAPAVVEGLAKGGATHATSAPA